MYDLLLFDLDGTISDPLEGSFKCTNYALSRHGLPEVSSGRVASLIGPPLNEAFEAILETSSPEVIDALVVSFRERQAEIGWRECCLYPEVVETLEELSTRGCRLAVCTSKPARFATQILGLFGIAHLFEFISGGDSRFPKRQQISQLLESERVPSNSIMIGDRAVDLIAAHRNGIEAAGVLWGYGSRAELEEQSPKYLFSSPREWLKLAQSSPITTKI